MDAAEAVALSRLPQGATGLIMRRIVGTGAALLILDLASKKVVRTLMVPGQSVPIVPGIFHLTYVLNPGAAFGLFAHMTAYFIVVAAVVIFVILAYGRILASGSVLLELSLGLQLGGAVGNLVDRVVTGRVIDFLDFRVWPVFNFADSAIVIGVGLFACGVLFGKESAAGK
ncbi:MAG: signal peptidase II [Firmicutes bacterium]|nr:signal peptidase II [Bacillota bacterium]